MTEIEVFEYKLGYQDVILTKNDIKKSQNDSKILKLRINGYKTNIGNLKTLFTGLETIKGSRYEFKNNYFSFFYTILGVEIHCISFINGSVYKEGDELNESVSETILRFISDLIETIQYMPDEEHTSGIEQLIK